jgi:hypothetical protein
MPISGQYSSINQILVPSIVQTASSTGNGTNTAATIPGIDQFTSAEVELNVTAASGTLDVYIQKQLADGAWTDLIHFTQATGTGKQICTLISQTSSPYAPTDATLAAGTVKPDHMGNTWRAKWVITGTSFTFTVLGNFYA